MEPTRYSCLVNRYANPEETTRRLMEISAAQSGKLDQLRFIRVPCLVLAAEQDTNDHDHDKVVTTMIDSGSVTMASVVDDDDGDDPVVLSHEIASLGISGDADVVATSSAHPNNCTAAVPKTMPRRTLTSVVRKERPFPPPIKDFDNRSTYYLLDAASVLVTEALDVQPGDRILDMCSAPGGKSLCIAQRLRDPTTQQFHGHLTCNEMCPERRRRLRNVLTDYLPAELFQTDRDMESIRILGLDGTQASTKILDTFDKILVDAPCSSDRHLLHDPVHSLAQKWTPATSKNLAGKQVQLLTEALRLVRVGGTVVYATCSLSSVENDDVVVKVWSKLKEQGHYEIVSRKWKKSFPSSFSSTTTTTTSPSSEGKRPRWPLGEPTKYGWIVLPDSPRELEQQQGWGPLYFSVWRRIS